jgi:predicted Zn-dependent protease
MLLGQTDLDYNETPPDVGFSHPRDWMMLTQTAEDSYRQGMHALSGGRRKVALALFEAAIEIERRMTRARPQPRYLSYYGLCLALERNETHEALRYCREAVTLESYNPDIRCNLGRVLLRVGRRREAHRCFLRGLNLERSHTQTIRALREMGRRRRPLVPFLLRTNPINIFLGRLRSN